MTNDELAMNHTAYVAEAWFQIKGRGSVATFHLNNEKCDWSDLPIPKTGQEICIDGNIYTIRGVETFKTAYAHKNEPVGILVGAVSRPCPIHGKTTE